MLKIGLTGGIGSGKSTVAKIFQILGIPVYKADQRAKQLQVENEEVQEQVQEAFGKDIYTSDGHLQTEKLAEIVFDDKEALQQLNNIVHPAVAEDFQEWLERQTEAPYIIKEAALIFEAGTQDSLDAVIVVTAPQQLRIERIIERDQVSKQQVKARMEHQWPESKKRDQSDHLILNNEEEMLIPQILHLHKTLLKQANY